MRKVLVPTLTILTSIVVVFAMWSIPKPQPKPYKPPINITNTGNKVGKSVGRFGRGFLKGLWDSNDNK